MFLSPFRVFQKSDILFCFFSDTEMPFTIKEKKFKHETDFCFSLLKFEIIGTRNSWVIRLRNAINFSETLCTSQMKSIFLQISSTYYITTVISSEEYSAHRKGWFFSCDSNQKDWMAQWFSSKRWQFTSLGCRPAVILLGAEGEGKLGLMIKSSPSRVVN